MLKPKLPDDPHDILMVAPDAVRVAPADEGASDPIRDLVRRAPSTPSQEAARPALEPYTGPPDFSAGAAVPPVDTTFRPTAVNDGRRSIGSRALRAFAGLLLTACIGGAAVAWNSHRDAAQQLIADWAPLFARSASQPSEKTGLPAQPNLAAAQVDAANASPPQPASQPEAATEAAAPTAAAPTAAMPPDQTPSIETMARDLANAGQEIEQLKASIEQLKASQLQLVAMVSEKAAAPAVRPRKPVSSAQPAPPPRPVATLAPARRPMPPPPPRQAIAAPPLPPAPAPAPYVPRQIEPQPRTAAETLDDPELPSVPRPPMPLR